MTYRELLAEEGLIELPPEASDGALHGYHLFVIRIKAGAAIRRRVFEGLREAAIGVQVHYVPIYRFATYAGGYDPADFSNSEAYYAGALSLPIFPSMEHADVDRVVSELRRLLAAEAR